jgi:RNA polymerase sigma-70 factor (ECF subfamily)
MSDRAGLNRLVGMARAGDAAALGELCEKYLPRLRNFFFRLGAGGESDDLTQQTLIKLIENIGKIRMGGSFESWLYRVAYNLFIDTRRRRSAQSLGDWDAPSTAPTPPRTCGGGGTVCPRVRGA